VIHTGGLLQVITGDTYRWVITGDNSFTLDYVTATLPDSGDIYGTETYFILYS